MQSQRTLIHSHVKWPCEEGPEGEKALNEFKREREWEEGTQRESLNITDPQISCWFLVQLEFCSKCLLKAPFLLPFHCQRAFSVR